MSAIGATLVFKLPERFLEQFVGGILITYVIFLIFKPNLRVRASMLSAALGGAGSGFLGGVSGVGGGALRAVVLTAFNLPKTVYIFTSGILGFVIDASRLTTYFVGGTRINHSLFLGLLIFIPASFLGAEIAKKFVNKIPQRKFRTVISIFLFLVGTKLLFF